MIAISERQFPICKPALGTGKCERCGGDIATMRAKGERCPAGGVFEILHNLVVSLNALEKADAEVALFDAAKDREAQAIARNAFDYWRAEAEKLCK